MRNNTSEKKALGVKYKKPPVVGGELSSSLKIVTTEVKGRVTKIQFKRGRLTREQMHHPPFHQIALWL
jgi:hypothetical protein